MTGKSDAKFKHKEEILLVEGSPKEKKDIFYTDEEPKFSIRVENLSDLEIKGSLEIFVVKDNDHFDEEVFGINLSPGESTDLEFETELLKFQASAILGVRELNITKRQQKFEVKPMNTSYKPLFAFTIWDREFYKANHIWPRRAQYASAFLSILIITVGVIQILTT